MPFQPDSSESKNSRQTPPAPTWNAVNRPTRQGPLPAPIRPAVTDAPVASTSSSKPRQEVGKLAHIELNPEQEGYLLKNSKRADEKELKNKWVYVAEKCNEKWNTQYEPKKFDKTVKYLENERKREAKRQDDDLTGKKSLKAPFTREEDQDWCPFLRTMDGSHGHKYANIFKSRTRQRKLGKLTGAREKRWADSHPGFESKIKENKLPETNDKVVDDEKKGLNKVSAGRKVAPTPSTAQREKQDMTTLTNATDSMKIENNPHRSSANTDSIRAGVDALLAAMDSDSRGSQSSSVASKRPRRHSRSPPAADRHVQHTTSTRSGGSTSKEKSKESPKRRKSREREGGRS
ncbi:hypothetical protein ACMFMG_002295 [Clarireedia jacksonii]